MKEIKELKFDELTIEQKIGMTMCCLIPSWDRKAEDDEFVLNLIKNHALGALWVQPNIPDFEDFMAKVKEIADYPLLIFTDAEGGLGDYTIGMSNSLGMTDNEELAYEFGKVTAITARKKGYNVVCNPVVDMCKGVGICGANVRSLGSDKHKVAKLAAAVAQGMHDGGVLTVAKHYPSADKTSQDKSLLIDSHMAEACSYLTKEELLDYSLFPYLELMKKGLMDGIMTGHVKLPNIDPDYPASLSKKVIDIIREQGFDGFSITDSFSMMGIIAKFGEKDSKGLAIENGNDILLPYITDNKKAYNLYYDAYKKGVLSDERLDEATKKVLAAQHKALEMQPKFTEITQDDIDAIEKINTDSVFAKVDEGLKTSISRDGKHFFVVLTDNEAQISDAGKVVVDTFSCGWYVTDAIMNKLTELFPNSEATALRQFPTAYNNSCLLRKVVDFDDVIFITYSEYEAYTGREQFTPRIISLIEAMYVSKQISTVVHFGNPYALADLPHISRILIGTCSKKGTLATLDVLAGNYPAKGALTYDVDFK